MTRQKVAANNNNLTPFNAMSAHICEIVSAPAIQDMLDNQWATGNMTPDQTPLLEFVLSEQNRSQFQIDQQISSNTGKLRTVEVIYDQPYEEGDVTEVTDACSTENDLCDLSQSYTFNGIRIGRSFELGVGTLKNSIEENTPRIAREVRKIMNEVKNEYARRLASAAVTNAGNWSVDTNTISGVAASGNILSVNTTLANGTGVRIPNAPLFEQLNMAMSMSRINSGGIFGQAELVNFVRRALAGGTNTSLGYDMSAMLGQYGIATAYDRLTAAELTTLGTATNIAVGLGAIVPVGFSLYESDNARIESADSIARTVYDPQTGMKFDFRMTRPCDTWVISVTATYDFFFRPTDLYKVGSNWEGVTGVALINVTCDDLTPCQD